MSPDDIPPKNSPNPKNIVFVKTHYYNYSSYLKESEEENVFLFTEVQRSSR